MLERALPAILLVALSAPHRATAQSPLDWHPAHNGPSSRNLVLDTHRNKTISIGGSTLDGSIELWEWDGRTWSPRHTAHAPSPRWNYSVAYDSARRRLVLYGGEDFTTDFTETWEWDGIDWSLIAANGRPGIRIRAGMAYDAARQRTVLYGGDANRATWEWDGGRWARIPTVNDPGNPHYVAMAYDPLRQVVVKFGGLGNLGQRSDDTWTFDGVDWTQQAPNTVPPARYLSSMAFDFVIGELVLYGGTLGTIDLADTWTWNGTDWTQRGAVPGSPGELRTQALSTDPLTGHALLHANATWSWTGTLWQMVDSPRVPPTESSPQAMVWDSGRRKVVLVVDPALGQSTGTDIWELEARGWTERSAAGPEPQHAVAAAYDAARAETVVVTSANVTTAPQTWAWNGTGWSQRAAAPPATSGATLAGLAYDAARQVVVGVFGATVWEWDGQTWALRPTANGPTARNFASLAYDPLRARTVLFGGSESGGGRPRDTWSWDGSSWTRSIPTVRPSGREAAVMVFDPSIGEVVLFGGRGGSAAPGDDTWSWDGSRWQQIVPTHSSPPRAGAVAAYDARFGRTIVGGGTWPNLSSTTYRDFWVFGSHGTATVSEIGTGCPGIAGVPALGSGRPTLGNPAFDVELFDAAPNAGCVFGFAFASGSTPLGGCTLRLAAPILDVPAMTDATGFAHTIPLNIPWDPALQGGRLYVQAFALDAQGAGPGISASDALELILGV